MPYLGEYKNLLDVVFCLYPDVASARAGVGAGGTGFFVAIPSTTSDWLHAYAVTNWHVALGHGDKPPYPIIRVNSKFGPPQIFDVDPTDWQFIDGHHDVAVLPIEFDTDEVKAKVIGIKGFFLSDADIAKHEVNVGEDAFILGRFIDYDGVEASDPSMRFGNLSVMKARQVQPTGCKEPSFVVDMRSGPGYSGSPVFVYRTQGSSFAKDKTNVMGLHFLKLLGILWGQFPEEWDAKVRAQSMEVPGIVVKGMSGISLVCPASAILKVLNLEVFQEQRAAIDGQLAQDASRGASIAAPAAAANPTHREDFMALLGGALKKPKPI